MRPQVGHDPSSFMAEGAQYLAQSSQKGIVSSSVGALAHTQLDG
jgi:hypothetical protein